MRKKIWMSWSSGKDSAFALYELRKNPEVEVVGLLTTVDEAHEKVAMHAVRDVLLARQAHELGLPLHRIKIPPQCSNELYLARMSAAIEEAVGVGISCIAFGDLFLEDVRQFRETMLKGVGIDPLFPLWNRPTLALAREMVAVGQRAIVTCVDPRKLPGSLAGREFDEAFLSELPEGTDPCGENGEFHTFVYSSPLFKKSISVEMSEVVERDGFVFADVKPLPNGES